MLHKRCKDYTYDEIREIDAEKCSKCKYRFVTRVINYKKEYGCGYILSTGFRRECRPEDCEYYKEP